MDLNELITWVSLQRGVARVEVMTEELMSRIVAEESTVTSMMGTPVDNLGLRDCLERGSVLLAFVDGTFWTPPVRSMQLCSSDGSVIGHDIPLSAVPDYSGRDDVMFISDDFIMYADADLGDAPYMQMLSQEYRGEDGSLPEELSSVIWFPSPSSNDILCSHYHQPLSDLATAFIAADVDRNRCRSVSR